MAVAVAADVQQREAGAALQSGAGRGSPHPHCRRGQDAAGRPSGTTVQLADPLGQAHLTALGAVLQIEHLLGADAPPAGVYLGEALLDPEHACRQLRAEGVEITAV